MRFYVALFIILGLSFLVPSKIFADCGLSGSQTCSSQNGFSASPLCWNNTCYYNGMNCASGACSNPYDANRCSGAGYDSCVTTPAESGTGISWCCRNSPTPTPVPFQCVAQYGIYFSCYAGGCPQNWVAASQNPNLNNTLKFITLEPTLLSKNLHFCTL